MLNVAELTVTVKAMIAGQRVPVEIGGEVLSALRSAGTSRQGTPIRGRHSAEALSELARLGLIGKLNGLTKWGSYAYLDAGDQIEAAQGW